MNRQFFWDSELQLFYRVKSLSKGNNGKKDNMLSSVNLRESTNFPLSSALPAMLKDSSIDGWPQPVERDEYDIPEETYDQAKISWKKNGKLESGVYAPEDKIKTAKGQTKRKDTSKVETKNLDSEDDELNDLLQVKLIVLTRFSF